MTSKPASRSAIEMTLAPRSWPSRPGLATTTRYVRFTGTHTTQVVSDSPMPPATPSGRPRLQARRNVRTIVGLSIAAVVFGGLLLFFVTSFAARHPADVNLGPRTFPVGKASRLAARIRDQHAPLLFKDPLTSSAGRELYVQHLGP